jgi:hypothetical protein
VTSAKAHFETVNNELNREIESFVQRTSAMEQRATILIGAASVVGALQTTTPFSWALVANLTLSFIAAVAGVVVVFPRRGDALDVRAMRDGLLKMPAGKGRNKVIDTKLEVLEADESWLSRRGVVALSIGIALAGSFFVNDSDSVPAPTPSPESSDIG